MHKVCGAFLESTDRLYRTILAPSLHGHRHYWGLYYGDGPLNERVANFGWLCRAAIFCTTLLVLPGTAVPILLMHVCNVASLRHKRFTNMLPEDTKILLSVSLPLSGFV